MYDGRKNSGPCVPAAKNPELSNIFLSKLGLGQNVALRASPVARNCAFHASHFPIRHDSFFTSACYSCRSLYQHKVACFITVNQTLLCDLTNLCSPSPCRAHVSCRRVLPAKSVHGPCVMSNSDSSQVSVERICHVEQYTSCQLQP